MLKLKRRMNELVKVEKVKAVDCKGKALSHPKVPITLVVI